MGVTHEPWLVLLSLVVAIQGAYVGLSLAVQVRESDGLRRRLLLAAAAISLAVAIWAMHFVAMLAVRLPFAIDYLVFPTLLSFLVCVIVVGVAVFAVSAGRLTATRATASAVFMGGGIATMHYIGMSALHASAHISHAPGMVVASVAIAIATSGLALWLAGARGPQPPLLLSATALGMAIAGMHYTAMAGLTLMPLQEPPSGATVLSSDLLAIVVAIVAFIVSGIFLLALVPERPRNAADLRPSAIPDALADAPAIVAGGSIAIGQGTFSPLGGAGGPPRRVAQQLPVEHDGGTHFVPVEDVVAVHANAHYTYVFDGKAKFFCPLAIGVVESRLDSARFIRVHRSHIVALDRIVGLKRTGDTGVIELAAGEPYTVPVSRGRLPWLKSRLAVAAGDFAGDRRKAVPPPEPSLALQHR
ncbi:MAG TPA: MHYT domain-containing protein [Stellaceae bacterium]|nr:MHYT domain-containing protein [Stellaceae bacterium]